MLQGRDGTQFLQLLSIGVDKTFPVGNADISGAAAGGLSTLSEQNQHKHDAVGVFKVITVLKIFLDYVVIPGGTWIGAARVSLDWIGRTKDLSHSLLGGMLMLALVGVFAYQTGYKGFYVVGRKRYFYTVFIAPIILGAIALLVGLLLSFK